MSDPPWEIIDSAPTVDGDQLILARTGERWEVHTGWRVLMTSELYESEEALAEYALPRVAHPKRVLVGGLGLGYTLRATRSGFADGWAEVDVTGGAEPARATVRLSLIHI